MGWRERFGADDERALIAARARALLDAAGGRPSPAGSSETVDGPGAPSSSPLPPPHGGWVPADFGRPDDEPGTEPDAEPLSTARHSASHPAADPPDVEPSRPTTPALRRMEPHRVSDAAPGSARPWRERVRFDPGRRGLVAVAAVVVVVGSIAGGVLVRGGQSGAVTVAAASGVPPSAAAPVAASSSAAPAPSGPDAPTTSAAPATVTVDVAGQVVRPGVYTLPAGSRVEDALAAAGGAKPGADLTTLNRARVLVDGEQLPVGVPGATGPAPAAAGSTSGGTPGSTGGRVDLNTADLAQLDTLPGVGPVLAQAIVDWRTEHGRFASVADLDQVAGIGPATFAKLQDLVTV